MMPWVEAERLERMGKRISSVQPNDVLVLNYQYYVGLYRGLIGIMEKNMETIIVS